MALLLTGCSANFDAKDTLTTEAYDSVLSTLAPYVIKKPDELTYENRFDKVNLHYYENFIKTTGSDLRYFHENDTCKFFFFTYRDLSSLYEHYRGLGGYYKESGDTILLMNILYHTPRFTKEELTTKGKELFVTMIADGNVNGFIGNKKYIHSPNNDFYYNTQTNRWDYTKNSSWKFIEEAKDSLDAN
jgi:hypothetical protein